MNRTVGGQFRGGFEAMHVAKCEPTVMEVPAEKRTLILRSGEVIRVPAGGVLKLLEVLKGHGQRIVVELTVPRNGRNGTT